jgi:hypothetical protein
MTVVEFELIAIGLIACGSAWALWQGWRFKVQAQESMEVAVRLVIHCTDMMVDAAESSGGEEIGESGAGGRVRPTVN